MTADGVGTGFVVMDDGGLDHELSPCEEDAMSIVEWLLLLLSHARRLKLDDTRFPMDADERTGRLPLPLPRQKPPPSEDVSNGTQTAVRQKFFFVFLLALGAMTTAGIEKSRTPTHGLPILLSQFVPKKMCYLVVDPPTPSSSRSPHHFARRREYGYGQTTPSLPPPVTTKKWEKKKENPERQSSLTLSQADTAPSTRS